MTKQKISGKKLIVLKLAAANSPLQFSIRENAELTLVLLARAASVDVAIFLDGKGAKATVIGLMQGNENDSMTCNTLQHHRAPETTSNLLIKSVLNGQSSLVYKGSIVVDAKAQKTDAYQRNENLLLGAGSRATSSPVLEIQANDVRCTHGAVVKTLDANELWYLASRGIDPPTSRDMIAKGFLHSALFRISDLNVRKDVETQLERNKVL